MVPKFDSFDAFWPYYVKEHSHKLTRWLHFIGTGLILPCIIAAIFIDWRIIGLMPIFGYGLAWVSHAFIERNKPATFDYPLWSLLADLKMFYLMLLGRRLTCHEKETDL